MRHRLLIGLVTGALCLATHEGAATVRFLPLTARVCGVVPACPDVALDTGPRAQFSKIRSNVIASLGSPHHRARDLFQPTGTPQWLFAKFVYGKLHKDLEGEDVDVWVLRGCAGTWERIGTARTSADDAASPGVDGAPAGNGRVAFALPNDKLLGVGLHRVRFVVRGDGSSVDALAEILPEEAEFFVSDIDGTLTASEDVELASVVRSVVSNTHRDAARVLRTMVEKGYRPLYLSARAEALTQRTHEFLAYHGFPAGAVRLTANGLGVTGDEAAQFKSRELVKLTGQKLKPRFGFGNRPSDTIAYEAAGISTNHRYFLGLTDPKGGRRFESYSELLPEVSALTCP